MPYQAVSCPYSGADPVIKSPQKKKGGWEITGDSASEVIIFPTIGAPSFNPHHLPRMGGVVEHNIDRYIKINLKYMPCIQLEQVIQVYLRLTK